MKKLKWFLLAGLIPLFLPVLIIIILMGAVALISAVVLIASHTGII